MNHRFVTSEVYSLRLNLHFVNLVYLRADDDEHRQSAWESIRTTLSLAPPILNAAAVHADVPGHPNVMNGRAIQLVQPPYPAIARQAKASGTAVIQVVIDESGDVILANATIGHPLLQAASVAAARASKFSPTKLRRGCANYGCDPVQFLYSVVHTENHRALLLG